MSCCKAHNHETKHDFVSSTVVNESLTAEVLYHLLVNVITDLQAFGFTTIGVVGDNVVAQQKAFKMLNEEYHSIAKLHCAAHTMNLILKYILKEACSESIKIVKQAVSSKIIDRYIETRWNSLYDRMVELSRSDKVSDCEKATLEKDVKLVTSVIQILKYSQSNDSNWAAFSSQLSNLKNDPSSASVIVRAIESYELYTQNSITDVVNAISSGKPCNTESQAWLKSLSMKRAEDLDCFITMKSISSTVESDVLSRLALFQKMILDRILLSEAQVERVFSRHKAIHTTMRANLSPDIDEKVLYIRYNETMCGLRSVADKEDKIVDEENCFLPLFVE